MIYLFTMYIKDLHQNPNSIVLSQCLDTQTDILFCLEIWLLTLTQSSIATFQRYFEWVNADDVIQFAGMVSFMMWH